MKFQFIQDLLGFPMSSKKRAVRKNLHIFYRHALRTADNESQRKLWIAAGIAAEELVTALLGLDSKVNVELFKRRLLRKAVDKQQIETILHAYLSAIIVSITNYKKDILTQTGLNEQKFIMSWCSVFEYKQEDMQIFDEILLPAYNQNGFNGLLQETGKIIVHHLYQDTSELIPDEITRFKGILSKDVSGLINYLNQSDR